MSFGLRKIFTKTYNWTQVANFINEE